MPTLSPLLSVAFLTCHGWNTTPERARGLYQAWYERLLAEGHTANAAKSPLFIGLCWPSMLLVQSWDAYVRNEALSDVPNVGRWTGEDGRVPAIQRLEPVWL